MSNVTDRSLQTLRSWAELARRLTASRSMSGWVSVHRMIEVTKRKLRGDADRLKRLLEQSQALFNPLDEPFLFDLGLHRWLRGNREEAYSDWIEWVVNQLESAEQVYALFGLQAGLPESLRSRPVEVVRELSIPFGHDGRTGRLDLVIRCGLETILVVEVKKTDADSADTAKHLGYGTWLKSLSIPVRHSILLATEAQECDYIGFKFLSWSAFCIRLRECALLLCRGKRLTSAAMILAFVSAIEQNLLGFPARIVREICSGSSLVFNAALVDHLENFVEHAEVANG